jgi:hypothetical protein
MNCYIINFVKASRNNIAELKENTEMDMVGSELLVCCMYSRGEAV